MLTQIFLLIVSTLFFGYCLSQIPFVRKSDLNYRQILLLFVVKVLAGFVIGYCSLHYYSVHNDYWDNNYNSLVEFEMLKNNPRQFFTELVYSSGGHYGDFWGNADGYWNDIKHNAFIKLLAPFHALTKGNYYLLSVIFNAFAFLGHVALYRTFKHHFKEHNWGLIAGCFLIPSFLLFSSGIHRDGFIFSALSLLFYCAQQIVITKKVKWKYALAIGLCLFFVFFWRNYLVLTLMAAAYAYRLIIKKNWRPNRAVLFMATIFLFGILISGFLPFLNVPAILSAKQADYFQIEMGASALYLPPLDPSTLGFIKNTFYAIFNLFFVFSAKLKILPFDIEWWLLIVSTAFLFFGARKMGKKVQLPPIWFALILFTLLSWLLIGHITPNLGALIRYRNMFLPFVFAPILAEIWFRLPSHYKK